MAELTAAIRVEIICPCGTAPLFRATNAIITLLLAEPKIRGWGGLTYSSLNPTVFTGMFWDTPDNSVERGEWEPDDNVLITLDAPATSAEEIVPYLVALRSQVQQAYARDGHKQKVLWITVQSLQILS